MGDTWFEETSDYNDSNKYFSANVYVHPQNSFRRN